MAEGLPVNSRMERQLYFVTCSSAHDGMKGSNGHFEDITKRRSLWAGITTEIRLKPLGDLIFA